jgi:hypothetical protein
MNRLLYMLGIGPIQPTSRLTRVRNRAIVVGMFVIAAAVLVLKPVAVFGASHAFALLDAETVLSDTQALTATALSTNSYDTAAAGNELGEGEPMGVEITVDVAADLASGDETYRFSLIQSANADLSSSDELLTTNVSFITKAILVAGYAIVLPLPPGMKTKRYVGVNYTLGGTTPSITVTARFAPLRTMGQKFKSYPSGFSVGS